MSKREETPESAASPTAPTRLAPTELEGTALEGTAIERTVLASVGALSKPVEWRAGEEIAHDIELVRLLGRGGMGDVFLAKGRRSGQLFAVKRPIVDESASREMFFEELQSWIDLPAHAHVVAAYFVRSVGPQLAVFAEFVDGGSLDQWVGEGRAASLDVALDLAIQFAWGLDAAHENGLVHQDVKPANALITLDGVLKVADFGLARARHEGDGGVRVEGMTPAFCSPEQARRENVSLATDVWSYGLSVLNMFAGRVFWSFGFAAPESLATAVASASTRVPIPPEVERVLARCFAMDPAQRWPSLDHTAAALVDAYRTLIGRPFPRARPTPPDRAPPSSSFGRRLQSGAAWRPAREWMAYASTVAGDDPRASSARDSGDTRRTRNARALADLQLYRRAEAILADLVARGEERQITPLSALRAELALVLQHTDDLEGAHAMFELAIGPALREARERKTALLENEAATMIGMRGTLEMKLGRPHDALASQQQALEMREAAIRRMPTSVFAFEEALTRVNLGDALSALARHEEAIDAHARAVEFFETHGGDEKSNATMAACLGRACASASAALRAAGLHERARAFAKRGLEALDGAVAEEVVAAALMRNYGLNCGSLGDTAGAVLALESAVELLEHLVRVGGRDDLSQDLASARVNLAFVLARGDGTRERAFVLFEDARRVLEALVGTRARADVENELARACINEAVARLEFRDLDQALVLADRAVQLRETIVAREEGARSSELLALAWRHKGLVHARRGELDAAIESSERAVMLLAEEEREARPTHARMTLAHALHDSATALAHRGRTHDAFGRVERAVVLMRAHIEAGQRAELFGAYVIARLLQSGLVATHGDLHRALTLVGSVLDEIATSDDPARDVLWLGAFDQSRAIALACLTAAMQAGGRGDHAGSRAFAQRAFDALEPHAANDRVKDVAGDLACARILRAVACHNLGEVEQARIDAQHGIAVLSTEVPRSTREDWSQMLTWALGVFGTARQS